MRIHWPAQQLDVRIETKTQDNVFVQLVLAVHYQPLPPDEIDDGGHEFRDASWQIAAAVFDAVDGRMSAIKIDDILEKRNAVAAVVMTEVAPVMLGFGYEIIDALVADIRMRGSRDRWSLAFPRFEPSALPELAVGLPRRNSRAATIHVTRQFGELVLDALEKVMHRSKEAGRPREQGLSSKR